jgi:glycosyltransferase involved in cell wall biosynthesis
MRVLSIHAGADTGGCSWGLAGAFERADGPIHFDSVIRGGNYIEYPKRNGWDRAAELWDAADVVHLHNTMRTRDLMIRAGHAPKPFVLHHHGTTFRDNHVQINRELRRLGKAGIARTVVATLDLLQQGPGIPWSPAAHDLEALGKHRRRAKGTIGKDRPIRIGHAPTDRAIKSTEAFLTACEKLAETHPVEVVLIEGKPWAECLALKGTCDVYFDQVWLGYGNNAIEAWAMGIPVVCGAEDFTLEEMTRRFGSLPFKLADEGSIYAALLDMCDAKVRAEYARRGKAHAQRWHDGTETVRVLGDVYADLIG